MFFCPNCKNALSITQQGTTDMKEITQATPTSVSSTEEENKDTHEPEPESEQESSALSNKAYLKCTNCGYSREIEPGTMILSRVSEKTTTDFSDQSKYKDMIHDATIPSTRNYICPNKECPSQNDYSLREAIFFKPNRNAYSIVYVCKACQTVWQ